MKILISESQLRGIIKEGWMDNADFRAPHKIGNRIGDRLNKGVTGKFNDLTKNDLKIKKMKDDLAKKKADAELEFSKKPEGEYYLNPETHRIRKLTRSEIVRNNHNKAHEFLANHHVPDDNEKRVEYFEKFMKLHYGYKEDGDNSMYDMMIDKFKDLLAFFKYDVKRTIRYIESVDYK